jgi:hypothetical protein
MFVPTSICEFIGLLLYDSQQTVDFSLLRYLADRWRWWCGKRLAGAESRFGMPDDHYQFQSDEELPWTD